MEISIEDKLNALSLISQRKLLDILDKIPGPKDFVIDSSLIKPLENIVGVKILKSHGVDKIFKLEKMNTAFVNSQVVFFVQANLISLKHVCDKVNSEIMSSKNKNYHAIILSKKLGSITRLIEEEGLHGVLSIYKYQWEMILLDTKVLSFENHGVFKSLFIDGDQSSLSCISKSIWTLKLLFGEPAVTVCMGKYSQLVHDMIKVYSERVCQPSQYSEIPCFLLVDRSVDYASTLLRGCTYTSLLDEVFGINSGFIEIPSEGSGKSVSYSLNSTDEIYSQIKNSHFASVFTFLRSKTKEMNLEFQRSKEMELKEMKDYVKNSLGSAAQLKSSLAYHIGACESIINKISHRFEALCNIEQSMLEGRNRKDCLNFIEDSLAMEFVDRCGVLRLIALLSLTQDGFSPSEVTSLKSQFLHVHGYKCLPYFFNLEKLGLFEGQSGLIPTELIPSNIAKVAQAVTSPARKSTFFAQAQKLKLFPEIVDSYDFKNPKDFGYVFNGSYIPLISQVISMIVKNENCLSELPSYIPNSVVFGSPQQIRSFLIYFIGGVTYAEISSLQLVERLLGVKIIIAGTSITNGNKIMQACF